jgi:hypothetical protein
LAVLWAALSVGCYLHPRIRNLENEIPDAIDEEINVLKVNAKEQDTVTADI